MVVGKKGRGRPVKGESHDNDEESQEWVGNKGHMRGSMNAFKSWIAMGVGYLVPRALEAGVLSVVIHNVGEEKNGVFTPITT
jgi:hypothetical protein